MLNELRNLFLRALKCDDGITVTVLVNEWNEAVKRVQAVFDNMTSKTVDAVAVVRCQECVMWEKYENTAGCGYCRNKRFIFRYGGAVGGNEWEFKPITEPEFSCSDSKRKGEVVGSDG